MMLVDSNTIGLVLGVSPRSVRKRAQQECWPANEKKGRGGTRLLYNLSDLPPEIQAKVTLHLINTGALAPTTSETADPVLPGQKVSKHRSSHYDPETIWAWYETRPQSVKAKAKRNALLCLKVRQLVDSGMKTDHALKTVAESESVSFKTLRRYWFGDAVIMGAKNAHPSDYEPALAPRYAGAQESAEFSVEAWEWIKTDWLRNEKPSAAAVYRRAKSIAVAQGWSLPSVATVTRRLNGLPWQIRVMAREGKEAFQRMLPHITRVKSSLRALEVVNADGHIFDVRVNLPSGEVGRPHLVAWQDIYSGKILSYRVSETFNQHIVRLSFGDLVEEYGIPEHCFLDNGREFANKWLTGGMKHRFRFTIKEDEPDGIFLTLGMTVHWATPYHGQSKPIERAFRDLCEGIAKHPACAGAYTGNSPVNKPANYGERVMEWDEFLAVVEYGIAEHNSRKERRTETARGRSFDEVFNESYSTSAIRKATAEQSRLWLLAGEGLTVGKNGHVQLQGNAYWSEELAGYAGHKVVIRFDPEDLTKAVYVYSLSGEFIGEAASTRISFMDAQSAKDHIRANNRRVKAVKEQIKAEQTMTLIEAAQMLPRITPSESPEAGVIAPVFEKPKRSLKVANGPDLLEEDDDLRPDERFIASQLHLLQNIRPIEMD